jgi:hypothetical protein
MTASYYGRLLFFVYTRTTAKCSVNNVSPKTITVFAAAAGPVHLETYCYLALTPMPLRSAAGYPTHRYLLRTHCDPPIPLRRRRPVLPQAAAWSGLAATAAGVAARSGTAAVSPWPCQVPHLENTKRQWYSNGRKHKASSKELTHLVQFRTTS